jgi:hypothetical protein
VDKCKAAIACATSVISAMITVNFPHIVGCASGLASAVASSVSSAFCPNGKGFDPCQTAFSILGAAAVCGFGRYFDCPIPIDNL